MTRTNDADLRSSGLVRPESPTQAALLRTLRDGGPRSRAQLSDTAPLSRSKLALEIDRLLALGLVENDGHAASRGGRRSTQVRIASSLRFLALDIGATSVDVAVTDGELRLLAHLSEELDVRAGPTAVLDQTLSLVGRLRDGGELSHVTAAGVGVPGPVSVREGAPVVPPIMPGWDHFPVRDVVARELGCPVRVDNDVNLMALGEQHAGAARGVEDFLFVKLGTGIGCGIVVDGRIHRGVTGSAGDIGHIRVEEFGPACSCGRTGCLEAFFGGAALARDALAAARGGRSPALLARLEQTGSLTAADVGRAAAAGDPVAVALVRDGSSRLGEVLASLVSFFNPGLVVLGGGLSALGPALLAEVRAVVYRRSLPLATGDLPIVLSDLPGTAGVTGAARLASDVVLELADAVAGG